ncbi:MAG: hypothetical protein Q7T04_07530, partial [Dehalococcoidia bacterium]|nr:hypothetical protein [Dehalococcoidia bacterium]
MNASADGDHVTRDRAIRLFKFLRELALLKTKIIRDLSEYEKVVWFYDVPQYKGCVSVLGPESDKLQDTAWLEIKHSTEPKRPAVPLFCARWLEEADDENPDAEPRLRDEIITQGQTERISDDPEVLGEWERWKQNSWLPWAVAHIDWKAADEVYFRLFSIYQQLKKLGEQYELLIGLGLLTWETPNNQVIRRHIIVGDANLLFDADRGRFELQPAPEGVKL